LSWQKLVEHASSTKQIHLGLDGDRGERARVESLAGSGERGCVASERAECVGVEAWRA